MNEFNKLTSLHSNPSVNVFDNEPQNLCEDRCDLPLSSTLVHPNKLKPIEIEPFANIAN